MLCECLNVWSEELNGAERADLWHCGASMWQTEEKPEPARNELVWAGVIICPAARADSLFRDLNWSSCNGVCGPEYRMRELQCHAMLYTSINNMVVCNPTFFEIQPEICLCAEFSSAFDCFCCCFFIFFLTEKSYFHCSKPFTDFWMLCSFNKSRLCCFLFCEEGKETWCCQQNLKDICSHLSWDRAHFLLCSQYSAVFCI